MEDLPAKVERDAYFPFTDDGFWFGGCGRTPVIEEEVYVCDQCTAAYLEWKKEHGKKEPIQASTVTATEALPLRQP
jgi:hypothetical protein